MEKCLKCTPTIWTNKVEVPDTLASICGQLWLSGAYFPLLDISFVADVLNSENLIVYILKDGLTIPEYKPKCTISDQSS